MSCSRRALWQVGRRSASRAMAARNQRSNAARGNARTTADRISSTSSYPTPRTSSPVARSSRTASTPSSRVTEGCMWSTMARSTRAASALGSPARSRNRRAERPPSTSKHDGVPGDRRQSGVMEERRGPQDPPVEAPALACRDPRAPAVAPDRVRQQIAGQRVLRPPPGREGDLVLRDGDARDLLREGTVGSHRHDGSEPHIDGEDGRCAGAVSRSPRST